MKVAVFGCLHGMLDEMYRSVDQYESQYKVNIDLILVCGDCQTVRHFDDLKCLSVPEHYKKLGDFHKYYSGAEKIPKLTIFVGGNHEASNYLMTLPYGGWVCDNFYYLGYAGAVRYKGLRIAGVSGIYHPRDCSRGRFERLPFSYETKKSIYHTRNLDIFRLQLLSKNTHEKDPLDVFLSHDWPRCIYDYGDKKQLLLRKPFFKKEIEKKVLGSPLTQPLIEQLKPKRWFAAHMHCRFYAKIVHETGGQSTEFLSLNKIENRRDYMEVIDLTSNRQQDSQSHDDLYYDEEWFTILRKTVNLEINSSGNVHCPKLEDELGRTFIPTDDEIQETVKLMEETGGLKIKRNFKMVEPVIYNRPGSLQPSFDQDRGRNYPNFQTEQLVDRLQLKKCNKTSNQDVNDQYSGQNNDERAFKTEPNVEIKPMLFPKVKVEVCSHIPSEKADLNIKNSNPQIKKRVFPEKQSPVELDEDGCLPFYVDTKGDK